ncbi:hypothetical protein HPB47_015733 [Ixodes persulcatus]|uniref:Uncharacterized protein n=1 Tax=Ixodes persulcatus TaxID=34615 RepID=A0AC60QTL7_IXOPE|nr:hypothetical protein HPB47_015733 [Ixodes persulcatus]
MEFDCAEAMRLVQARLSQYLALEIELDSSRSEREVIEMALFANSFTIAALAVQSVERIERRLWSYQRGECWFEATLPHLGVQNFKACFRVMPCTFRYLVDVCRPTMQRETTNMRTPISVEKRVAIALYKLCSTAEDRTIGHLFGVGRATVNIVYREFCRTIVAKLEESTVAMVRQSELYNHMLEFEAVCGFPSAIGALDGCHLAVSPPKDQYCNYRNYKGWYSIILLAIVDHRYTFRYVNVGSPGKCHDAHVYRNSRLPALLSSLRAKTPLVVNGTAVPPIVLCDQAFPLTPNLMKPFPHGTHDKKKGASEILERTRWAIRKVVPCDVLEPGMLPEEHRETFDDVLSSGCLNLDTADHESFRRALSNVGNLVKSGGLLFLATRPPDVRLKPRLSPTGWQRLGSDHATSCYICGQTKVVPSAITYLCFCVVTSGFPAVLIGVVAILTYIFAASPCDESAMWLPCIPNIPRSEYFYDSVSQDCLPKDNLPIGCLNWNEVPGAKDCRANCLTPRNDARRAASVKATGGQAPYGSHPHTARRCHWTPPRVELVGLYPVWPRSPPGEAGSLTIVAGATPETNEEVAHSGLSTEQLAISFPNGTRFGANITTHNRFQLIDMGEGAKLARALVLAAKGHVTKTGANTRFDIVGVATDDRATLEELLAVTLMRNIKVKTHFALHKARSTGVVRRRFSADARAEVPH